MTCIWNSLWKETMSAAFFCSLTSWNATHLIFADQICRNVLERSSSYTSMGVVFQYFLHKNECVIFYLEASKIFMELMEHHQIVFHDSHFNKYAAIVSFGFRKLRLIANYCYLVDTLLQVMRRWISGEVELLAVFCWIICWVLHGENLVVTEKTQFCLFSSLHKRCAFDTVMRELIVSFVSVKQYLNLVN